MALPLARFLNYVYTFATDNLDEKERRRFDIGLQQPPAGRRAVSKSSPWSAQQETAALQSLAAALRGGA